MVYSASILGKDTAVLTETCFHGTTEKLAPPGPLLFSASSELHVSKFIRWQCLCGARKPLKKEKLKKVAGGSFEDLFLIS